MQVKTGHNPGSNHCSVPYRDSHKLKKQGTGGSVDLSRPFIRYLTSSFLFPKSDSLLQYFIHKHQPIAGWPWSSGKIIPRGYAWSASACSPSIITLPPITLVFPNISSIKLIILDLARMFKGGEFFSCSLIIIFLNCIRRRIPLDHDPREGWTLNCVPSTHVGVGKLRFVWEMVLVESSASAMAGEISIWVLWRGGGGRCKSLHSVSAACFRSLVKEEGWYRAVSGCGTCGGHRSS